MNDELDFFPPMQDQFKVPDIQPPNMNQQQPGFFGNMSQTNKMALLNAIAGSLSMAGSQPWSRMGFGNALGAGWGAGMQGMQYGKHLEALGAKQAMEKEKFGLEKEKIGLETKVVQNNLTQLENSLKRHAQFSEALGGLDPKDKTYPEQVARIALGSGDPKLQERGLAIMNTLAHGLAGSRAAAPSLTTTRYRERWVPQRDGTFQMQYHENYGVGEEGWKDIGYSSRNMPSRSRERPMDEYMRNLLNPGGGGGASYPLAPPAALPPEVRPAPPISFDDYKSRAKSLFGQDLTDEEILKQYNQRFYGR